MLSRLLLALLGACLSLPALAMPVLHAAPTEHVAESVAGDCHKPAKQQGDHAQKHECIGCIARYDGLAEAAVIALLPEPLPTTRLAVQLPQTRAGPDTPPPRS